MVVDDGRSDFDAYLTTPSQEPRWVGRGKTVQVGFLSPSLISYARKGSGLVYFQSSIS